MAKKKESFSYEIKFSKKYLTIIVAFLLILSLAFISKKFLVVATVNGKPIDRVSLLGRLEKQNGKKILETMVTETLILEEAKKRKVTVSQKELDQELKKIESNVQAQGSSLDQALKSQGMTKNDLIYQMKIQLALQKMVGNDVKVSEKEIDDFIKATKSQQGFENQEISREQAIGQLKQQKAQQKIQGFLTDLKAKAKITYFVNY